MELPSFLKFDIEDEDEAALFREEAEVLVDYVCEIEAWTVLSSEQEKILDSALEWVPYAIRQLNDADARIPSTKEGAIKEIQAALGLLHAFEPKVKAILLTSEDLKREAKAKEEELKVREVAVESPSPRRPNSF
ncbi:uncharacterized protein F4812DRAFT_443874 [Daldinia caldariorum]|uniref:uncharacterized protein n=1 Tax=Daldinia caldariorum TaxID=326644 RepID=UPI0020082B09|nr:uncharacterized protein F4812DRAFT_443874 [Daldinia caldariorum]KAI1464241.1 hypothetical protein F4812DRAFT_443874 [Daldinia caldariorum]